MTALSGVGLVDEELSSPRRRALTRARREAGRGSPLAWLGAIALCLSIFSGNFRDFVPVPVDRVVMVALLVIAAISLAKSGLRLRPIHAILAAQFLWVVASAAAVGTLATSTSFYALTDQVVVPSILFTVAGTVFATPGDRVALLRTVAITSIYVGVVSSAQALGLTEFIFPRYIASAAVHGTITRAVGPSLQVASNGAMLIMCLAPSLFLAKISTGIWRALAIVAVGTCCLGAFFSLTRSVWIGGLLAIFIYMLLEPRLRRFIVPAALALATVIFIAFQAFPTFAAVIGDRAETVRSLDDRSTTNLAALQMLNSNPLLGVGWGRFLDNVDGYVRQQDLVPLTTTHILAHNVVLSRAAELGFVGALLFVSALVCGPVLAIVLTWLSTYRMWAVVLLSTFAGWLSVAMLTPMGYAFPNYFLWLLAGVALSLAPSSQLKSPTKETRDGAQLANSLDG